MLLRQKAILRLIQSEGGGVGKTRLFKLVFLCSNEAPFVDAGLAYQFVPYQFGPYSFTLFHELKTLERDGLIRIFDNEVKLTEAEPPQPSAPVSLLVDSMSRRYKNVCTEDLISIVYKRFPWFTSKARDKSRRAMRVPVAELAVYTVGYEGLMLDGLLDLLLLSGIKQLVDVRANAVARRFGFHKSTLDRHCTDLGILYVHLPQLGIASAERADLTDVKSYERLFATYNQETLNSNKLLINELAELIRTTPSALMCMEADPLFCHRSHLASRVSRITAFPVKELRNREASVC